MIEPLPAGWVELDEHLVRAHNFEETLTDGIDSDEARVLHELAHGWGDFSAGRRHSHAEIPD